MSIVEEVQHPAGVMSDVSSVSPATTGSWIVDDSAPHRFDPVHDLRIGVDGPIADGEWISAVVEQASAAIAALERIDTDSLDADTAAQWAEGVERLRRESHAAAVTVADHVDEAQPFRHHGFFTAKAWLKHRLQLSGPEAHGRVQEARLRRRVPVWNLALSAGQVGVAQTRLMARIAANPRSPSDTLAEGVRNLMIDAFDAGYDEFERLATTWESLADPIGAAERAERNRERRSAVVVQRPDAGWTVHAELDETAGPEFLEIFSHYVDREFDRDWKEAVGRLGDGNVDAGKLARTEAQRRADALLEMARAAAACPPDRNRPLPTVNYLLDEQTAATVADNDLVDPARYRDVVARTDRGHRVDPNAIIGVSLWALLRRVVTDTKGTVIDLGRTTRLFTGAAREAVMLLEPTCIWPGCDQPHSWCHADHLTSWTTRGPTDADNGAPLCPRHNYLKELGFTITRDADGRWRITTPDGTEIT